MLKLEYRFWLSKDGSKIFGRGPCDLLKLIDSLGSLNKAAMEMNMSYSKAWSLIQNAEEALGYPLLERETGGRDGGGSYLTSGATSLIKVYDEFTGEAEKSVEKIFKKYFPRL